MLFIAPEQVPEKQKIKQLSQEDLMKVDMTVGHDFVLVWSILDYTLHLISSLTDIPEFPEEVIGNYLNAGDCLPMPNRYYFQ